MYHRQLMELCVKFASAYGKILSWLAEDSDPASQSLSTPNNVPSCADASSVYLPYGSQFVNFKCFDGSDLPPIRFLSRSYFLRLIFRTLS